MENRELIRYFCENDSNINHYVFETIFWLMGVKAKKVSKDEDTDIYYGNNPGKKCTLSIAEKETRLTPEILTKGIQEIRCSTHDRPCRIEFDFIYVMGMILSDSINKNSTERVYDNHQRLAYKSSVQSKYNDPTTPLLNAYILSFKHIITSLFEVEFIPLWPENKKACFILSHDVDNPDKYSFIKSYRFFPPKNNPRSLISYQSYILGSFLLYLKDANREENWLFDKIMEAESKYGFTSTFYFASRPYFDKKATDVDVRYDIKKKRFRNIFKKLISAGFEVGLHASYDAFLNPELFVEEKRRLEKYSKTEVIGLRHHYWHLGPQPFQTQHFHKLADFKYDSSFAFNYHPGYRFDIAFPFYPFDIDKNERIDVMQLPSFLMDGNLFYKEDMTLEEAMKITTPYIDKIIAYNGIGAIDWHVRTSYPGTNKYNLWGQGYLEILDYLGSKPDIWVTSAKEVYEWLEVREKKLGS